MIEFDEYKVKLNGLKPTLTDLGAALKLEEAQEELAALRAETEREGFWTDVQAVQKNQQRTKQLQNKIDRYAKLQNTWDDLYTICEMAIEENDDSMLEELESGYADFESTLEQVRLQTLLSGEYDANNAILSIHPGAGGTEAQDWASMLYRMYTRWAERHGYSYTLLDWQDGEEAGIKSATIKIEGENAYGYLKSENGVHRLVRISPFDASGRRQTSFAAVEVMPEITDTGEIELRDEDIKM
ncbi:MAG: PCRF domain-containing protein, partial [Oscillospiraceae bacterium]